MSTETEAGERALSRERLVSTALDLVQDEGLDALSMRALADRLQVKAASLYWHVRNRAELLELLAEALLGEVRPPPGNRADWRSAALGLCAALEQLTSRRRDAARLLLEVPDVLERSQLHANLADLLSQPGLPVGVAAETASMLLAAVLAAALRPPERTTLAAPDPRPLVLAIDSGSRGVGVRAGPGMGTGAPVRAVYARPGTLPGTLRGDRVIVRELRGGRLGQLELSPANPWSFHIQGPTWNTTLNLLGLDVRGIKVDSGAGRVECILPPPRGVVPIDISSGVVGVRLRRPPGVAVEAEVNTGSVQLRLDGKSVGPIISDLHWRSRSASGSSDRYQLSIHSGTVRVSLEEDASLKVPLVSTAAPPERAGVTAALNVALDGVSAHAYS